MISASAVNLVLSILTAAAQVIIILLLGFIFIPWRGKHKNKLLLIFRRYSILLAFIVALVATGGSLVYSEVIGYEPCRLCWFQRILMYPQVIILGVSLWKRDNNVRNYIMPLSVIGALIAGYHYLLQIGVAPSVSCDAVGYSVQCSKVFSMSFGYITIPMMALTAFVLISLLMVVGYAKRR